MDADGLQWHALGGRRRGQHPGWYATELVLNQKRGQILPVSLFAEPEIRDLLSAMDTTDPAAED